MKERNLEQKKTPMWIDLVRHGMTRGNEERRYIGITDEPLSERGRKLAEQCMYEMPEIVFSSPLKRCVETAEILYPDQDIYIIEELRECDFGIFEGKNAEELSKTEAYQRWIDSNATIPFPGGESREGFRSRCLLGWKKVISVCQEQQKKSAAVVTHGGVIMNLMETVTALKSRFMNGMSKICADILFI